MNSPKTRPVLYSLPGWQNSEDAHWQTLWEKNVPSCVSYVKRVIQQDWDTPVLSAWLSALDAQMSVAKQGSIMVTHSLGGILLAHWTKQSLATTGHVNKVKAALIVAPPCQLAIQNDLPVKSTDFIDVPLQPLPFKTMVVCSTDDPYDSQHQAYSYAKAWGAELTVLSNLGHINAHSGLGAWSQGQLLLDRVCK